MTCDWRIRRVTEAMHGQQGAFATVEQFAKGAGLSRAQFFRLFEESLGLSPKVYLNVVRMERALDAVIHQDAPVGELSARFGFSEPAHFTRFFRDHAGVGPREFRHVSRLAG
jgi:transcriptional regulator GlxA family with amidase domain